MKTQFDLPDVLYWYANQKNYEIITLNKDDDRCYIYFSSNGIYFPNTEKVFKERIVINNRYDWKKNLIFSARKVILVRDILQPWYLKGINVEINTIEKLLRFFENETNGLRVTCVGSSAGGYAATLFACLLKAERAFNFSGQFSLYLGLEDEKVRLETPYIVSCENIPSINKYFSLRTYIQDSKIPIFYFYPEFCPLDAPQMNHVKDLNTVYFYSFNSSAHSKTCYPINYLDLFASSNQQLIDLCFRYKNNKINPLFFSFHVSGLNKTLFYLVEKQLKYLNLLDR